MEPSSVVSESGDDSTLISSELGSSGHEITAITDVTKHLSFAEEQEQSPNVEMKEETSLLVLSKYLSVAVSEQGSRKPSALLKDETMSALLVWSLMEDSSIKITTAALDVFEILLTNHRNHALLQKLPCFLPMLERISREKKYTSDIRQDCANMLRVLKQVKKPLGDQPMSSRNIENAGQEGQNTKTSTLTRAKQRGRETILKVGSEVLQHNQNRLMIERALIKIKGIISLTFDLPKNYCIIRGKQNIGSEVFGSAVANLGFNVSLVYKNEHQEEIMVSISPDENNDISKENLPDYLPEDYANSSAAANAVCKQKLQDKNSGASIINSALNFVRSSFYW